MARTNTHHLPDGTVRTTDVDLEAGTVTISEAGKATTLPIPASELAMLRAADREQRQLDRLDANFRAMRDSTRLTPATYRQNTGAADLRPLVQEVNALRAIVLDLARLVRGMAADE